MNMNLRLDRSLMARAMQGRSPSRLRELDDFGSNPGGLKAWFYAPSSENPLPLVVALHGCTQTAGGYDTGTGWSELAEAHGFAVLLPEQQRANNPNLCFNWFEPGDARRRSGEPLSIAQMIDAMVGRHGVDGKRVFITGLSAGGAMTSNMLAAYPEKFAGGAILAGLPHGAASSMPEAFQQMRRYSPTAKSSGRSIREAASHDSEWPAVSIWHGTADTVVDMSNAEGILRQWQEVHGVGQEPTEQEVIDGHPRRGWRNNAGRLVIEEYRVLGMGHGAPLAVEGECGCGETGAFMLEAGISSTLHSARTWGLIDPAVKRAKTCAEPTRPLHSKSGSVRQVIEDALRTAGLMR
ncbi:PHB depolymerase family esterase [Croceibacterium sp. LX-88]|uniref:PHB depolymerase family esterase n=1 Tax=Croceibacterium selenioxidans TaxID=2838833 RepID=A0ABS5W541_9SPHN|nr:PHB depolymerase family esterase [Croceibacterium selenioxidans]MBT2134340.1 PHB depolymerase family esterase [Croceibacterium selenioxidans]